MMILTEAAPVSYKSLPTVEDFPEDLQECIKSPGIHEWMHPDKRNNGLQQCDQDSFLPEQFVSSQDLGYSSSPEGSVSSPAGCASSHGSQCVPSREQLLKSKMLVLIPEADIHQLKNPKVRHRTGTGYSTQSFQNTEREDKDLLQKECQCVPAVESSGSKNMSVSMTVPCCDQHHQISLSLGHGQGHDTEECIGLCHREQNGSLHGGSSNSVRQRLIVNISVCDDLHLDVRTSRCLHCRGNDTHKTNASLSHPQDFQKQWDAGMESKGQQQHVCLPEGAPEWEAAQGKNKMDVAEKLSQHKEEVVHECKAEMVTQYKSAVHQYISEFMSHYRAETVSQYEVETVSQYKAETVSQYETEMMPTHKTEVVSQYTREVLPQCKAKAEVQYKAETVPPHKAEVAPQSKGETVPLNRPEAVLQYQEDTAPQSKKEVVPRFGEHQMGASVLGHKKLKDPLFRKKRLQRICRVYVPEDLEEPAFQYVPEVLPTSASIKGGVPPLQESLMLLGEGLEAGSLVAQFEQLYRRKPGLTVTEARRQENEKKNRYRDISPYDSTRVILTTTPSGDYINASYVNMEVQGSGIINRYIACQGPLAGTCTDFWHMVWEQQSTLIVMLTTVVEQGRVKCHRYWPRLYETVDFGILQVTCNKEEETPGFAFREFTLINTETQEERHITHMQYLAWPDHGVPDDSTEFLNFVTQVRKARVGMVEPTIVHCSAGIGRTGVLILMETAQCLIEANEPIYPLDIVKAMRDQRAMMIQTASQFRFVCEAIHRVYTEELVKPLAEYQQR